MARKKWSANTDITPELIRSREKRKWQIALRRYVLEKNPCVYYAPYFGMDIQNLRKWFEIQFSANDTWESFAKSWQFEHIIPVTYFDFSNDTELGMCWNFTNLRVVHLQGNKENTSRLNILAAKGYFETLYKNTQFPAAFKLLQKISEIERSETIECATQQFFILENRDYLNIIQNYSSFEFELLNSGRSISDVIQELNFLKKF